jgi:hypothetical protein
LKNDNLNVPKGYQMFRKRRITQLFQWDIQRSAKVTIKRFKGALNVRLGHESSNHLGIENKEIV